jgi:hypothetical protein
VESAASTFKNSGGEIGRGPHIQYIEILLGHAMSHHEENNGIPELLGNNKISLKVLQNTVKKCGTKVV